MSKVYVVIEDCDGFPTAVIGVHSSLKKAALSVGPQERDESPYHHIQIWDIDGKQEDKIWLLSIEGIYSGTRNHLVPYLEVERITWEELRA